MLLVIDVGNTNIVVGVFKKDQLITNWRIRTERNTTEDEFNLLASGLFAGRGISSKDIERTIISCVVPPMVTILDSFCQKYLGHCPTWVDATSYRGMPILLPNPSEVGADRIVNAVAAYRQFRSSLVVIDFGTATTFDAVSPKGEYLGGVICPGIMISAEALFRKASKLPRVEIFSPSDKVIGNTTIHSIQSGIIYGYAGLVDGVVKRMRREMGTDPKVVATGGLAELLAGVTDSIDTVNRDLTLAGLRIISEEMEECKR